MSLRRPHRETIQSWSTRRREISWLLMSRRLTSTDPAVTEIAQDSSSDTRDSPSDGRSSNNGDRPSDARSSNNRDRPSDAVLPNNGDRPSDDRSSNNGDRPSDATQPKAHSLLWPGVSEVALFLFLVTACFIITYIVVNIRSHLRPSPELPCAVRIRARDHRRAVLRLLHSLYGPKSSTLSSYTVESAEPSTRETVTVVQRRRTCLPSLPEQPACHVVIL